MIQRIQSLYLSLSVMLTTLLLYGKIVSFVTEDGNVLEMRYNGLFEMVGSAAGRAEHLLPLTLLLIIVPILLFVTLLLYKFRKLQLRAAVMSLLLLIGLTILVAYYIFYVSTAYDATVVFSIKVVFPPVAAVLTYLAFRGILRDELLIRSYERLR